MMKVLEIAAESRSAGKKETKAVRAKDFVPINVYAKGIDPVSLAVDVRSLKHVIYTHERYKVQISEGSNSWDCIVKQVDFHPVTDVPIHVDFLALQDGHKVKLTVPLNYVGTPAGQLEGGVAQAILQYIDVECLPKDIPGHIDVDVSALNIGDSIHVGSLDYPDIRFLSPERQTMFSVVTTRMVIEEVVDEEGVEGEEGEEGEGGEGEEGAAADSESSEK